MKKILASIFLFTIFFCITKVGAQEGDVHFFRSLDGSWRGSGEVVAGKYKGTRFQCSFTSMSDVITTGLVLDGTCRMGLFSQSLKAQVMGGKNGGFFGHFNEGARGDGLDITAGRIGADHVMFDLQRENLQGTMQAQLLSENDMQITLSVKVAGYFIPVIGVNLQRNQTNLARNLARN